MHKISLAVVLCLGVATPGLARANASGVGLGLAVGAAYSGSKTTQNSTNTEGTRPAWGFFVDIPLLQTFYISPAAMLYSVKDATGGTAHVTDVDMNFKFIVPIGDLHLGAGITAGLTSGMPGQGSYAPHYGVLGYVSYNLVANLDAFVLLQYKKLTRESETSINDTHGFVGANFRF